jgi:NAD(P)-dependent dehydrogenase (short-subunit alcohol dehydrogenase family)
MSKNAIVIGASSGIGFALTQPADSGANVKKSAGPVQRFAEV